MGNQLAHLEVSAAQIHQLIGMSKQGITNTVINALFRAGLDVINLKAIHFARTPQGGCIFQGPARLR